MRFDVAVVVVVMLLLPVSHSAIIIANINPANNEPIRRPWMKQEYLSDHGQYLLKNDKIV